MDVVSSVFGKAFSGCCRSFQSQCGEVSWRELMDFKQVLFIRVYLIYQRWQMLDKLMAPNTNSQSSWLVPESPCECPCLSISIQSLDLKGHISLCKIDANGQTWWLLFDFFGGKSLPQSCKGKCQKLCTVDIQLLSGVDSTAPIQIPITKGVEGNQLLLVTVNCILHPVHCCHTVVYC